MTIDVHFYPWKTVKNVMTLTNSIAHVVPGKIFEISENQEVLMA
jgi:hypothetical protein